MDAEGAGELLCARHHTPTRLTCVECDTPICPKCAIRTPVGFKCPDHAWVAKPRRKLPSQVTVLLVVVGLVVFVLGLRHFSVAKPVKAACPTRQGPDVGIGPNGGGVNWTEMAKSPLCGRFDAASVWTGKELIVWGGQNCAGVPCPSPRAPRLADGAAYDPVKNRWRRLAASPLSARDLAAVVWTGKEMLVWGGDGSGVALADGAAYDPARDRWQRISASPLAARAEATAAWTGKEMIVWGGAEPVSGQATAVGDGAAYDPVANTWRRIADAPIAPRRLPEAAWTGSQLVVWGGTDPAGSVGGGDGVGDGAAYDPASDRWRLIATSPLSGRSGATVQWTGKEMVVWGGDSDSEGIVSDGAAYDPSRDSWRSLPAAPRAARFDALSVWSGKEVIVWGGLGVARDVQPGGDALGARQGLTFQPAPDDVIPIGDGLAYDPAADRWRPLEPVSLVARASPTGVWDGQGMIVWGGLVQVDSPTSASDGARYHP